MFAASKTDGVVAGGPPPSGDPYWSSVSLLTNFENNLTFRDESTNNFAITRNGVVNPSLRTPFSGGVGGSEWFNGSSELSAGSNAAFAFGTGAYTVECWVYLTLAVSASHRPVFVSNTSTGGFAFYNPEIVGNLQIASSGGASVLTSGTNLATNTWSHVVAVRSGTGTNLTSIFVNGTRVANGTDAKNWTVTGTMQVGGITLAGYYLNGFVSNVRVVKGTAVYNPTLTTLTVPTAPLTAITNTSLLITGTGQGMFNNATFVDQGPNALTVTATGAPVYSGRSPFGNTYPGSVLFNGSSGLNVGNTSSLLVNTDFTWECWINLSSLSTSQGLICVGDAVNRTLLYFDATQGIRYAVARSSVDQVSIQQGSVSGWSTGTWYHVAVVRSGNNYAIYRNGTSVASGTSTYSQSLLTNNVNLGYSNASPSFLYSTGFISNARIVNGTAVYTANFTPSTTPLTAITNTSLLVRGDTGAFYDLSNNGLAETGVGSPVVTTQIKKYGLESGSFNGTTDLITSPNNTALDLSSGDFTIECWINPSSLTTVGCLAAKMNYNGSNWTGYAVFQSNQTIQFYSGSNSVSIGIIATGNVITAINTWYFITVVKSGSGTNNTKIYINGVQQAQGTPTIGASTFPLVMGGSNATYGWDTGRYFLGYLDDIRITKGVARYTANFTPPTATFPTGP